MALFRDSELLNHLVELDVVPKNKLEVIYNEAKQRKISFYELLVERDLVTDANLGRIIAELTKVDYIRLSETQIDPKVLQLIPEVVAKKQSIIAYKVDNDGLHLAMSDPSNIQVQEFVSKKSGQKVVPHLATQRDIENALLMYKKDMLKAFDEIISENIKNADGKKQTEPSIIKIINAVIEYAYQNKASDIHIEPYDKKTLIRFRVDGILHDIVSLPKNLHDQLVTRVKVISKLRTDEHHAAQDGKISFKTENESLDIRVSVVPITEGEKIVMRLLSERSRQFSLHDLGFSDNDLKTVRNAYEKPHGMILATGPTGSGKTSTLYAILKLLNKRNVNIMTIEDPVEYDIGGVNQIQVNVKTELTFAKGLRSIVRQDPDIVLVGEIRDEETADISINAAMTGHLVLSTLHTNDAATSIPRLIDLGVEPFLVGSTVNLIIAQRLVRKICESCRYSEEVSDVSSQVKSMLGGSGNISDELINSYFPSSANVNLYRGKGCVVCHSTGFKGRIGIFEVLEVDDKIREAIAKTNDANTIRQLAKSSGMKTMIENGLEKVKQGVTTLDEVLRVTKE